MTLTPEQIQSNWERFLNYIETYITGERKEALSKFYHKFEDRIALMPASHKKEYHNAFPGGYVEHVNRVVECALRLNEVWKQMGVDDSTYTIEELVFSALNHDLGKMGDENFESYIPQTDQWRKDKLGEDYMFNNKLPFSSVPDRGLFLLQSHGITYSFNEMVAIQTHDGLYDEANKKYLMGYTPEQKPRTSLLYIVHQADLMAARIEFERDWLPKFKTTSAPTSDNVKTSTPNKAERKQKTLATLGTKNAKINNVIDDFFS
jgi:hypothetical protein